MAAMSTKMKEKVELCRLHGHLPNWLECPHCRMTRGVTQTQQAKMLVIVPLAASVATGSCVKHQPKAPNMKVLVLTEMSTRMIGCALVGAIARQHCDLSVLWWEWWVMVRYLASDGQWRVMVGIG